MMIRFDETPCRRCDKHDEDCHSICQTYKTWRKGYDEEKSKVNEKRNKRIELEMVRRDSISRNRRKK